MWSPFLLVVQAMQRSIRFQSKESTLVLSYFQGAFHLSELTGQPIPTVMWILLLIKTNHQHQSNPKYYVQKRWFFSKTSFSAPRASVWSKNKGDAGPPDPSPGSATAFLLLGRGGGGEFQQNLWFTTVGCLRNDNGDGNENGKKAMGLC